MQALRIEESVDTLRYNKVILATDADVDGMHIRNLLITYFLRFFQPLVSDGHLFILETPLFRVRNKKETRYCYSEEERQKALKEVSNPEITRFKGLGEISPKEFKAFIDEGIRLTQVGIDDPHDVPHILKFYMGKNTPQRREYILNHLVVEEDTV
jgi:topoisomerase-4 subunit B